MGQTTYTPGPGYYGVTRNPNYLHFYNSSFPELYQEPDPSFYASKLRGPVIRPPLTQTAASTEQQPPGPGAYFQQPPEERLLRAEVLANQARARAVLKLAGRKQADNRPPIVPASIQDQKRRYDYVKMQNDVVILERDDGKADPRKVGVIDLARTWQLRSQ